MFRYKDDVLSLNNFVDRIYPIDPEIKDTIDTDRSTSYIDLHLHSEGRLRTKLYEKRDDFNFLIVNFLFICSKIPAAPAHAVYIFQLIRYSSACGSYQDLLLLLTRKLLNQGLLMVKLKSSIRKFYGRHHDLVNRYGISVSQMTSDMFHLSYKHFHMSWSIRLYIRCRHKSFSYTDTHACTTYTNTFLLMKNIMLWVATMGLGYGVKRHFQQYLSYIVAVSFIGGGNRSTRSKPPTFRKSLTNFIT